MSVAQQAKMLLTGCVYVGHRTRPGWRGSLPFYRFKCPVHGIVENYPAGYERRLECPLCLASRGETNKRTDPQVNACADEPETAKPVQRDENDEYRLDRIPPSNPRKPERR